MTDSVSPGDAPASGLRTFLIADLDRTRPVAEDGRPAPGTFFLDDIVGENAFRRGKASHISGLAADGDELSITLVAPRSDLVSRLALPFFCRSASAHRPSPVVRSPT